jgi:hypothetical protein
MHIFGNSHVSMHSFALFISLLFIVTIFEAGYRVFGWRVAYTAVILVCSQEMFFMQSSYVLFEVLVAFLCFLSIFLYIRGQYFRTAVCLTMVFFTKESGLVAGAVLGIDAAIALFAGKQTLKQKFARVASVAVPCLLIGGFFLVQKYMRGWYVFPLYTDTLQLKWPDFWYRFRMCIVKYTFDDNYEYRVLRALLVLALIAAVKNSRFSYLSLFVLGYLIYQFTDNYRADGLLPGNKHYVYFNLVFLAVTIIFSRKYFFEKAEQRHFFLLLGIFILAFLNFSTLAYFSSRYLMVASIPVLFLVAVLVDKFLDHGYDVLYLPVLAVVAYAASSSFKFSKEYGDIRLGALKGMNIQQKTVDYLEERKLYDVPMFSESFLTREHLIDPSTGFLRHNKVFSRVSPVVDKSEKLLIFDNIEPSPYYADYIKDSSLKLIYRVTDGPVWAEIYQRD